MLRFVLRFQSGARFLSLGWEERVVGDVARDSRMRGDASRKVVGGDRRNDGEIEIR